MSFLSKVHRKVSSKSSLHSITNTSPTLSNSGDGLPPSPPTHLSVDFGSGSGSTLMTSTTTQQQQHCGGDESISSSSSTTHFTHSPSSTPPKKTWEKNYKSFLKKKSSSGTKHHTSSKGASGSTKGILTTSQSVGNATSLLQSKVSQPLFSSTTTTASNNNRNRSQSPSLEEHLELTKGGFVDGFDIDHSNSQHLQQQHQFRRASTGESSKKSSTNPREAVVADNRLSHNFTHPPSPTKHKESLSSKGGSFFKRVRSRTSTSKSTDDLDASLRRGGSRYSPSNTPPGSVPNTPIQNQYDNTPSSLSHSGGSGSSNRSPGTLGCITLQDGIEKAALLNESLFPPPLTDTTSDGSRRGGSGSSPRIRNKLLSSSPKLNALDQVRRGRGNSSDTSDSLDSARHRGHTTSSDKLSQSPADSKSLLDTARHRGHISSDKLLSQSPSKLLNNNPKSNFSRVQSEYSMGAGLSNLAKLPEGKPAMILHNKHLSHGNNTNLQRNNSLNSDSSTERHEREKRKAFTDFHNMGVDSSSAYLGDDSSLHKNSVFLSSMAYPAGSAGGKAHSRHTITSSGQPHSFDPKRGSGVSPSTSMGSISETKAQHADVDDTDYSPERSLRCLRGPEHWKKGERHAIIPGVLSMCPIQVLNNIMSKEETTNNTTSRPSLVSGSSNRSLTSQNLRGSGIGSIISEDDGSGIIDSSGWFFADHHQQQQPSLVPTKGVGPLGGGLPRPNSSNMLQPSNFGKIVLGKATVAPLGMRSFLNEVYGWCTGVFILRQNYLFEYREGDSLNGLPWGYSHLPLAEAYPHKHFTNALHLDFFERPCIKSGKRSLLLRVESKSERDRWVSLLTSAACMTMHDLYDVDESEGAPAFGHGRYAVVRPAKRRNRRRTMSFSTHQAASNSQGNLLGVSSYESLGGQPSNPDLEGGVSTEYDCALKIIDKKEFWSRVKKGRERADTLVREAAVQTTLTVQGVDAPSFLRLRNLFETGEKLVLELELLKGTDLFQHVSSRGVLDEVEAAHIMRDLLNCLNVLDQIGVAHRDIKPANLLMCQNDNNDGGARIKLADYGMASFVGVDNLVRGRCGTPGFVAPEILLTGVNGGYGNRVDMFSAGVTLYVMLAGYEPFYGESDAELIDANREAKVDFPHSDWHNVSLEGRDLVERLLVVDPAKRLSPSEALRHPWVTRRTTTTGMMTRLVSAVYSNRL